MLYEFKLQFILLFLHVKKKVKNGTQSSLSFFDLPFEFMPIVIEVLHLVGYKQSYAIKNNNQPPPTILFLPV